MSDPLVWWLSSEDFEALNAFFPQDFGPPFPEWLGKQLRSARGRAGRGRLWVDPMFGGFEAIFNASPLATHCGQCAGIVIGRGDLEAIAYMPGVVTDRYLRRLQ